MLSESEDNPEELLVKPEFEGLWNKEMKAYDVNDLYKTQFKFPPSFKTKAERVGLGYLSVFTPGGLLNLALSKRFKELYLKSLDKLKKSAVREQVAAGKKFKGASFKSQPRIIQFKVSPKYLILRVH